MEKISKSAQSKQWIMESLIDLMRTKKYEAITISEIAEHADLARRTFYRNFATKDEVLKACVQKLIQKFLDKMAEYEHFTLKDSMYQVLVLCEEEKELFTLLIDNNLISMALHQWRATALEQHLFLRHKIIGLPDVDDEQLLYMVIFISGGVFSVIEKWAKDGMQKSPDEISHMLSNFTYNNLPK